MYQVYLGKYRPPANFAQTTHDPPAMTYLTPGMTRQWTSRVGCNTSGPRTSYERSGTTITRSAYFSFTAC